jgi:hypothetical protein
MLNIAVGHTEDIDSEDAADELLDQCGSELNGEIAQAGILYASIDHDLDLLLETINSEHPGIELIGCTTDGELSSVLGFAEDSITLILFNSDDITIISDAADGLSEDLPKVIADSLKATKKNLPGEAKLCLVNPVSITSSGVEVLENFKKNLGTNFPIYGGAAADQWRFERTYQFHKNRVLTDSVPYLLFSGDLLYGSGVSSGWDPIGSPGTVTRVEKNILYEIDNTSAIDFYKHYLGENITPLGEYPLAVFEEENSDSYYLRAPLASNPEEGTLIFAGDLSPNSKVQISHTTRDRIIEASKNSITQSFESYPGSDPEAAICFSCSGRKQVLGTRTSEEYNLLNSIKPDLKVFGFYGYGEIAPLIKGGPSRFHNESFVSLLLGTK